MSAETYLAWNGQAYPWPPPEGWYEAADGRWWAPGSGPVTASTTAPAAATATADTAVPDHLQSVDGSTPLADRQRSGDTTANPVGAADPAGGPPADRAEQTALLFDDSRSPAAAEPAWSPPENTGSTHGGRTTPMPLPDIGMGQLGHQAGSRSTADTAAENVHGSQDGRSGIPVDPLPGHSPGPAMWRSPAPPAEDENRTPLFIAAGVAGVLVIAVLTAIGLTRGDQQEAGSALPTSDGGRTSTTAGTADDASTSPGDQQATSTRPGGGEAPPSSGADPTTGDSSVTTAAVTSANSAEATTAAAPTTSTSVASIDTLTDAEKVSEFRAVLQTNGLGSDQLTDEDLIEFGTSFCIFAIAADDLDQYVGFREEAIDQSESQLTGEELSLAVDAAIQVFCPDEAVRLGIG